MKDMIRNKRLLNALIRHKNIGERSRIFCDWIEYMHDRRKFMGKPVFDHHLMFWSKGELVFKVWLKQNREYKNINEALKDVGIEVFG
ncbi:hypothetical protein COV19_03420 [Candidatus Woesearchaeota archaeon CG10_big_fil_rev_8_21_14_0_10_44_13]|nr:MAG: hypothetical protein COV19_03420 [Candidatus Woesearchaeota archaeon CG10_big_fil_rev_8_21_14_0_10_44_13]